MEQAIFISIYLDTRRAKANGKFPVKLRAFTPTPRKQKLYPTIFEFTKEEFKSIWETTKPRKEHKEFRRKLLMIETKATAAAVELHPFTFEQFEKKLFRKVGEGENVFYQYGVTIERLRSNNQIGNAGIYELSLKSIKDFIIFEKGWLSKKLTFYEITPAWLTQYEKYMIGKRDRSRTTVSMYLRALRMIFNTAISEKEIAPEVYPFGKKKYQIPAVKSVKKALTHEQLSQLFHSKPQTPEQERAKDYWFFSYSCNGMNIKDIALLRYENLQEDKIIFYRAKTINTGKTDLRPVTVYLTDFSKMIIEKYGNPGKAPKQFVFSILSRSDTEMGQHRKVKNFTRFINQNLKKLALANNLPGEVSTYWARHSFATNAIRSGASMEFVSEALNHSNLRTTQGYFAGFEESSKKVLMDRLMDFSERETSRKMELGL